MFGNQMLHVVPVHALEVIPQGHADRTRGCCTAGGLITNKYSTVSSLEGLMENPKAIPEVAQAGFSSEMADDVHNELKVRFKAWRSPATATEGGCH